MDIEEVETGLEEVRAEERETGYVIFSLLGVNNKLINENSSSIRSKTNDELFQIDVKGDEEGMRIEHSKLSIC